MKVEFERMKDGKYEGKREYGKVFMEDGKFRIVFENGVEVKGWNLILLGGVSMSHDRTGQLCVWDVGVVEVHGGEIILSTV